METSLTVVVISYNTRNILQRCLEHLVFLQKKISTQLIVVDNCSTDGSADLVEDYFPSATLIRNDTNIGFARANNQGIAQATRGFILLLNSDAFITVEAVQILVDYMRNHPTVGICGPQLLFDDGSWQRSYGLIPSPRSAILDSLGVTSIQHIVQKLLWEFMGRGGAAKSVEYVDGACMLIRRAVVEQIGFLATCFFFFVEDAEFCHRARQNGWGVMYVPESRVVHLRGQSSANRNAIHRQQLKKLALQTFITAQYGPTGWDTYIRWMRRNFRWRFYLCTIVSRLGLSDAERCVEYSEAYSVYE